MIDAWATMTSLAEKVAYALQTNTHTIIGKKFFIIDDDEVDVDGDGGISRESPRGVFIDFVFVLVRGPHIWVARASSQHARVARG